MALRAEELESHFDEHREVLASLLAALKSGDPEAIALVRQYSGEVRTMKLLNEYVNDLLTLMGEAQKKQGRPSNEETEPKEGSARAAAIEVLKDNGGGPMTMKELTEALAEKGFSNKNWTSAFNKYPELERVEHGSYKLKGF